MSGGMQQGPPPKGPANSTRFELEVYHPGKPLTDETRTAVSGAIDSSGLAVRDLRVSGYYNDVDDRSRVQVLGTVDGAVITTEELLAAVSGSTRNLRIDAQTWPVYQDLPAQE